VTVLFSPVLNPPLRVIAAAESNPVAPSTPSTLPVATLDRPVTLEQRIESRASVDESANHRWNAAKFFLGVVKENPSGLGTGFTNRFVIGPHNSILKLAVDNGIIAAILLLALLGSVSWLAFKTRSPQLISLSASARVAAMLYHTLMVDPIVLPALAIGLAGNAGRLPNGQR
jgi:O-antigen ligase